MRGFLCLAIAMTAACGGDGVHFEVVVPDGMAVDRVDLFLATGAPCKTPDGSECTAIAPPRIDPQFPRREVPGLIFEADAAEPLRSDVQDGSAWFFLAPTPGKVKAMIAIGHDAQGAELGALVVTTPIVLDDGDQYLAAELVPIGARLGEGTPAAEQWPRDGLPYSCAGAQLDDQAVFIVPKDDPDCDHVAADLECAPTTFKAQEPASNDLVDLTCVTAPVGACELGDQACDEINGSPDRTCVTPDSTRYCVPDFACDTCPTTLAACAQNFADSVDAGVEITHLECRLATELVNGQLRVCAGLATPATLSPINHELCGGTVAIADLGFDFSQFDSSFTLDPITIQPKVANAPDCKFTLQPSGDLFSMDLVGRHAMLVEIETIPNQQTFVVLPLVVEVAQPNDCAMEGSVCDLKLAPGDKIATCLP